jgi:hypothetical protein
LQGYESNSDKETSLMMLRRFVTSAALLGAVVSATPAFAQLPPVPASGTAQASFYELTENMRLVGRGKPRRVAQSALVGTAAVGTPMCPTRPSCRPRRIARSTRSVKTTSTS